MITTLTILTMVCLAYIAFQDFKERKVYWWLFLLVMLFLGTIHFLNTVVPSVFLSYIGLNVLFVTLILCILYLFTKIIARKRFLDHSLGLGDILFFYAFALGFPTLTFIILFANAILFALFVFLVTKRKMSLKTVPLAGLMGLFLILVFGCSLTVQSPSLYGY
ncbi:hypothetical protein [Flagellimonas sp. 2504JD1-5]